MIESLAFSEEGETASPDLLYTEDRHLALRALLSKPLLLSEDPADADNLARIKRHKNYLCGWFSHHAGWNLEVVEDFARLRKTPADLSASSRPAIEPHSGEPLTRRRYAVLCLALAVLSKSERQISLGQLAGRIVELWNDETIALSATGFSFRLESQDERRDMVQIIRLLLAWRVLQRVDGDEERFLHDRSVDVLYNIRHPILARLLNTRQSPSLINAATLEEKLAALTKEPLSDDEEQRNRNIRLNIVRRLLDDPVVYYQELDDETREYLLRQRWHIMQQLAEATGLEAEERSEGFALCDPIGDCTDLGLPEEGTDGHVTILVAEFLAGQAKAGDTVGMIAVEKFIANQVELFRSYWRKDATEPGAERRLARDAVNRLANLSLARVHNDTITLMPAIHRFRLGEPILEGTLNTKIQTE
ncbi:MAG: TIGR02678 family protein [Verrucomicrobiales bacterium]|nr:TIGR02678 family protein [Verrucomicrobiales bacterium]